MRAELSRFGQDVSWGRHPALPDLLRNLYSAGLAGGRPIMHIRAIIRERRGVPQAANARSDMAPESRSSRRRGAFEFTQRRERQPRRLTDSFEQPDERGLRMELWA